MPIKTTLKSGDIVEIITSAERSPHRSWLNWVATASARQQIKKYLNLKKRSLSIALGKKLWDKELKKYKLPADFLNEAELLQRLNQQLGWPLNDLDDFYYLAGSGQLIINEEFIKGLHSGVKRPAGLFKKMVETIAGRPAGMRLVIKDP
jgi:GTP pyrophosphokinase